MPRALSESGELLMELSRATMGRLPIYAEFLRKLPADTKTISATAIARALGLGEVQVRKDLSAVCGMGKPKIGYEVSELVRAIDASIGARAGCEAVIVGAGKLGKALLGFKGFADYGLTVRSAFDLFPDGSPTVYPIDALPEYCRTHQIEIGIITVPPQAAQEAADRLVRCGVRAIWCFAPVRLELPDTVAVQYENMALSLAHLHQSVRSAAAKRGA